MLEVLIALVVAMVLISASAMTLMTVLRSEETSFLMGEGGLLAQTVTARYMTHVELTNTIQGIDQVWSLADSQREWSVDDVTLLEQQFTLSPLHASLAISLSFVEEKADE